MNETELIIAIRAALETGNFDLAKLKMDELNEALDAQQEAAGASAQDMGKLRTAVAGANSSMNALAALARGDVTGALNTASSAAMQLVGNLGKASFVVGALIAGWKLGTLIDKTLGLSDAIAKLLVPADNVARTARLSADELQRMADTRMDALKGSLDGIVSRLDDVISKTRTATQQQQDVIDAKTEQKIAEIEATEPEGPEREKKIAALRHDVDQQKVEIARKGIETEISAAAQAMADLKAEGAAIDSRLSEAKKKYAEAEETIRYYTEQKDIALQKGDEISAAASMRLISAMTPESGNLRGQIDIAEKEKAEFEARSKAENERLNAIVVAAYSKRDVLEAKGKTSDILYGTEVSGIDTRARGREASGRVTELSEQETALERKLKDLEAEHAFAQSVSGALATGKELPKGKTEEQRSSLGIVEKERAEAEAAAGDLERLRSTRMVDGRRVSPESFTYKKEARELESKARAEAADAVAAAQAMASTVSELAGTMKAVAAQLETVRREQAILKGQIRNS